MGGWYRGSTHGFITQRTLIQTVIPSKYQSVKMFCTGEQSTLAVVSTPAVRGTASSRKLCCTAQSACLVHRWPGFARLG